MNDVFPKEVKEGLAFFVRSEGNDYMGVFISPDKISDILQDKTTLLSEFLLAMINPERVGNKKK